MDSPSTAASTRPLADRLTEPQRRHLVVLYGDGTRTLYWKMTHGAPEHRSAVALERLGLVYLEGSLISRSWGGYALTEAGAALAKGLIHDAD